MDFAQERVTTCHDLGTARPAAPTGETAVVVPMLAREHGDDRVYVTQESDRVYKH